jgi:SAM-dependent methyltransferase
MMNKNRDFTASFEDAYLRLRKKEHRVIEDTDVLALPHLHHGPHQKEWRLRAKSARRFMHFLQKKSNLHTVVEIGCGNGWFTHLISKNTQALVYGTEVNKPELAQAHRLFGSEKTRFVEFNLATAQWPFERPDLIVFNASIQYFPSLPGILQQALLQLNLGGQVHIIDSPFYAPTELAAARERSASYFKNMGEGDMENFYFHHSVEDLQPFQPTYLYKPPPFPMNRIIKDSPFPWISITKPNE